MVVESRGEDKAPVVPSQLDLAYLGLFLGLRVNELVTERLAAEGFADVRESHGSVIQHLIGQDRTITELAERMEISQQAASKAVAELIKVGAIETTVARDRRTKWIRLSERGWRAVKLARKARAKIESRLMKSAGADRYDEAKKILLQCLEDLGGIERIRSRRIRAAN
jgi:DNA-binding MarR family transcriptional regulator